MTSHTLRWRRLDHAVHTEQAFAELFARSPYAFWLDSSRLGIRARYSFLGESDRSVRGGFAELSHLLSPGGPGSGAAGVDLAGLPPELACGYVGYFGYELPAYDNRPRRHVSPYPDSWWLEATRFAVVDHLTERTWLVERGDTGWLTEAERVLRRLHGSPRREEAPLPGGLGIDPEPWLVRGRDRYLADVSSCLDYLRAGESYEICLTDLAEMPWARDPLQAYRSLRRLEPAPYGAYLRFADLNVLSASPECFLSVEADGLAECRPIKGSSPRGIDPATDRALAKALGGSVKTQAENLMIVDLLRNDLGRVCEPGSITVPEFLVVESYATMHQLVSTVRGRLRPEVGAVDAVRACFPPGSMTGAPKVRTMEILDELETRARGVYSGVLGYFGLGGTARLSVVIRTAVVADGLVRVGAGGAVVLDSEPEAEYAEMLLKAAAPLRAFAPARPGRSPSRGGSDGDVAPAVAGRGGPVEAVW